MTIQEELTVIDARPGLTLNRWLFPVCLIASITFASLGYAQSYDKSPFLDDRGNDFFDISREGDENSRYSFDQEGADDESARSGFYRLNIGDTFIISVYGDDRSKREVMVDPRGTISYLFVDALPAAGKTIDEVREDLTAELRKYYRYVKLAITPIKFSAEYYTVTGYVNKPGKQALVGRPTALSALCKAQGFAAIDYRDQLYDMCDLDRAFLARNGEYVPVDFSRLVRFGDLSQDVPLQAGDFIYVPNRAINQVFVVGEVMIPATIDYFNDISLVEAIAEAGDVTERASSRVVVLRGSLACPTRYLVDYTMMVKGCYPNFQLQPGDIVYVPPRKLYLLREIFRSAVAAFVGTVAAQAGLDLFIKMQPDAAGIVGDNNFISSGGVIIVP